MIEESFVNQMSSFGLEKVQTLHIVNVGLATFSLLL